MFSLDALKKKSAVIFDLDGTLACTKEAYKGIDHPDLWCWHTFEKKMSFAPVIGETEFILKQYLEWGVDVIILTARPEHLRESTVEWLNNNDIPFKSVVMMSNDWFEKQEAGRDHDVIYQIQADYKKEALYKICQEYFVSAAFDDSKANIDMFKEAGILAFHIVR